MKKVRYFLIAVILVEILVILLINYVYMNHIVSKTTEIPSIERVID